eukprot:TRINITY_DN33101_c0_g1_i1.p1 TRINITY_DN33101_c0_g1~~TRINITY_DN33101_c0_g1_i1.p1  ORF type:complete len:258 (-),score=28.74 TRINITY_DN33101_c0_g1_i1:333-1067(-)
MSSYMCLLISCAGLSLLCTAERLEAESGLCYSDCCSSYVKRFVEAKVQEKHLPLKNLFLSHDSSSPFNSDSLSNAFLLPNAKRQFEDSAIDDLKRALNNSNFGGDGCMEKLSYFAGERMRLDELSEDAAQYYRNKPAVALPPISHSLFCFRRSVTTSCANRGSSWRAKIDCFCITLEASGQTGENSVRVEEQAGEHSHEGPSARGNQDIPKTTQSDEVTPEADKNKKNDKEETQKILTWERIGN